MTTRLMKTLVAPLAVVVLLGGCSDYVQSVNEPLSTASDAALNTPRDLPPFVRGVQNTFSFVFAESSVNAGGLSDEMFFSTDVPGSTFPQYRQIDNAAISGTNPLLPNNNSVQNAWSSLCQLRLYADTLAVRVGQITYTDASDSANIAPALFTAYFYGAIARVFMANYWGLEPTDQGGGVVASAGPYVPAADLYTQALALLTQAEQHADSEQSGWVNTLRARIHLYRGDFAAAKTAAEAGMATGSAPLQARFNSVGQNEWHVAAGRGRTQFTASDRYKTYVDEDPTEANRIPLRPIGGRSGRTYNQQDKYDNFDSPINFMTWQENTLVLAECAIRSGDNATGLSLVNAVRASHGVKQLTAEDVDALHSGDYEEFIFVERDKELCFTGLRLMDQVRFNKWHLDPAETWKKLPISQDERNANPNFD
jgi:starch-binding outer membrane protein, SusD/RagB family